MIYNYAHFLSLQIAK